MFKNYSLNPKRVLAAFVLWSIMPAICLIGVFLECPSLKCEDLLGVPFIIILATTYVYGSIINIVGGIFLVAVAWAVETLSN